MALHNTDTNVNVISLAYKTIGVEFLPISAPSSSKIADYLQPSFNWSTGQGFNWEGRGTTGAFKQEGNKKETTRQNFNGRKQGKLWKQTQRLPALWLGWGCCCTEPILCSRSVKLWTSGLTAIPRSLRSVLAVMDWSHIGYTASSTPAKWSFRVLLFLLISSQNKRMVISLGSAFSSGFQYLLCLLDIWYLKGAVISSSDFIFFD